MNSIIERTCTKSLLGYNYIVTNIYIFSDFSKICFPYRTIFTSNLYCGLNINGSADLLKNIDN